jgi:hypothetical protein
VDVAELLQAGVPCAAVGDKRELAGLSSYPHGRSPIASAQIFNALRCPTMLIDIRGVACCVERMQELFDQNCETARASIRSSAQWCR